MAGTVAGTMVAEALLASTMAAEVPATDMMIAEVADVYPIPCTYPFCLFFL